MKCLNCEEGAVAYPHRHIITITRDMALDAQDPSLEGQTVDWGAEWEWGPCPCCEYENWQDCPRCTASRDDSAEGSLNHIS